MFFLAILSAARCDQFYPGCTQNYKDILGTRSHFIRFYTLIKPGQFTGKRYITGKSYGGISFDSGYNFFPSWKLESWNSFCITASTNTRVYQTFINGKARKLNHEWFFDSLYQEVLAMTDYEGFHQKKPGNIFLLNAFFKDSGFSYPMKAGLSIVSAQSIYG